MGEKWPDLAGRIDDRRHLLPVRVYYEDTDFSRVVYHASYLRFCERGRSDFLRLAGARHADLRAGSEGEPLAFAVRRMEIEFLKPARIDDVLEVETRVAEISGATLTLDQRVVRAGNALFTARVQAVTVNGEGHVRRLPALVRRSLAPFVEPPQS